jgi:polyphosphate kinase
MMIVRSEEDGIRRYLHMGTGNYNARTAKIYTDIGLMTCDRQMGEDASDLFNYMTGYSGQDSWGKFLVAPVNLRPAIVKMIQQCIQRHTPENPSSIRMTMNALVDPEMIQMLYKASNAGIEVELLIRGICCLKPGIKGVSENITVRSIVGRFLEHTRIFHFHSDGLDTVYIGSADLMQRNLNRRMEILFPIEQPEGKARILQILDTMFADNVKARELQADGNYVRVTPLPGQPVLNAQQVFLEQAHQRTIHTDTIPENPS